MPCYKIIRNSREVFCSVPVTVFATVRHFEYRENPVDETEAVRVLS